jgi:organic hydroperoxide reductase OsmC/OhrA
LDKDGDGKIAVTKFTLRPRIAFSGDQPTAEQIDRLHHRSHEDCFIANSVKTEIRVESQAE